jgi:hypothetical protein
MLTKQQIADEVYKWFFVLKNKQARSEEFGTCRYRTEFGNRCAVGCCIPDSLYDPAIEGSRPKDFFNPNDLKYNSEFVPIDDFLGKENEDFLTDLQAWHDKNFTDHEYLLDIFEREDIDTDHMPLLTH